MVLFTAQSDKIQEHLKIITSSSHQNDDAVSDSEASDG